MIFTPTQTGEDALANIRSQLARDMARKLNQKLISQVWGLVSADGAPLNETHVCDVSDLHGRRSHRQHPVTNISDWC